MPIALTILGGASVAGAAPSMECNGSARLCNVPLGQVAFATTHNSMSSAADGFIGPNQDEPIKNQLQDGIRGFQIDAFLGVPRHGRVWTELAGPFGSQATDLPPSLVALAVRTHEALGAPPPGTPDQVYLCHSFCELGAVEMLPIAKEYRRFLDTHSDDVLVIVVEDYVPPDRLRSVLDQAGLTPMLLAVQAGTPLPTLREMVRSGHRLLVTLENGDGGPTLANAFHGIVDETPFTFHRPTDLDNAASCRPNRGGDGAPIFQFNHWLTPQISRAAALVNRSLLASRVNRCAEIRGRPPTLVAVDFAKSSDVVSVVQRLNR